MESQNLAVFGDALISASFLSEVDKFIQIAIMTHINELVEIKRSQMKTPQEVIDAMFHGCWTLDEMMSVLLYEGDKANKPKPEYESDDVPVYVDSTVEKDGVTTKTIKKRVPGKTQHGFLPKKSYISVGVPVRKIVAYIINHFMCTLYSYYKSTGEEFIDSSQLFGELVEYTEAGGSYDERYDVERFVLSASFTTMEYAVNYHITDSILERTKKFFKNSRDEVPEQALVKACDLIEIFLTHILAIMGDQLFCKKKKVDDSLIFGAFRIYNTFLGITDKPFSSLLDDSFERMEEFIKVEKKPKKSTATDDATEPTETLAETADRTDISEQSVADAINDILENDPMAHDLDLD